MVCTETKTNISILIEPISMAQRDRASLLVKTDRKRLYLYQFLCMHILLKIR